MSDISPERWARISALFDRALDVPAEQRGRFLDESCGADLDLKQLIAALLAACDRSAGFLEEPVSARVAALLRELAAEPP